MKRVLIVGSGWASTLASYLLEKNGISTTIVEKKCGWRPLQIRNFK